MTFGELKDAALEDNNEVDFSWFSESFVERTIKDAVHQINAATEWLQEETTITLVTDQKIYSLPNEVIKVIDVNTNSTLSSEGDVKTLPQPEEDHYGVPTERFHYRERPATNGRTKELVVQPSPTSGENGDTWTIRYHKRFDEDAVTEDTDVIPLPTEIRPHIMDYVDYRVQRKDKEQMTQLDLSQWQQNAIDTLRSLRQTGERSTQVIDHIARPRVHYRSNY